jgi:hypothetical protein
MLMLAVVPVTAHAAIVVDHPPARTGSAISDTNVQSDSELIADDFIVDSSTSVHRAVWWGDYAGDTPPEIETMRIRLYGDDNGLPGNLLYDSTVVNPFRAPTGLFVPSPPGTCCMFPEYMFEADLTTPMSLSSNIRYWLEIAQIDNANSSFDWEYSSADQNGFAYSYPSDASWQASSFPADLSFQLDTVPEPGALALIILGVGLSPRTNRTAIAAINSDQDVV